MIFISGISRGEKDLDQGQILSCPSCGTRARMEVFMTYTRLSLFFIPIIKWGRSYYGRFSCCGALYGIREEVGRGLERGQEHKIASGDLEDLYGQVEENICQACRASFSRDYKFCPYCGRRIV